MTDTTAAPTPESALSQALGVRQSFRRFIEDEGGPLPDYDDEAAGMLAVLSKLGYTLTRSTPTEALDQVASILAHYDISDVDWKELLPFLSSPAELDVEDVRSILRKHESDCSYFDGGDFACSCGYEEAARRVDAWLDARDACLTEGADR